MAVKYTDSELATYRKISPNKSVRKGTGIIDTIIPHVYVGKVTAKQGADHFANASAQASSHYIIGWKGDIAQSVPEKYRAWTTGGKKNGIPIRVNGISGSDMDNRSITIEVASETKSPYKISAEAYASLITLITDICKRNNINKLFWQADKKLVGHPELQNMAVHRWFALKSCPGDYLFSKMGEIKNEVNRRLFDNPESSLIGISDFTPVFDPNYYANKWPDVVNVLGKDPAVLLRHFIEHGIKEGRQACASFDVRVYKANNPDLQAVYGDDMKGYVLHYLVYGRYETARKCV